MSSHLVRCAHEHPPHVDHANHLQHWKAWTGVWSEEIRRVQRTTGQKRVGPKTRKKLPTAIDKSGASEEPLFLLRIWGDKTRINLYKW